jgi:hypothetical protein
MKDFQIQSYVDGKKDLFVIDSTFHDGRYGFWANSTKESFFDDIQYSPTDTIYSNSPKEYHFRFFEAHRKCMRDFSNWYLQPDTMLNYIRQSRKALFEPICYEFKDTIHGNFNMSLKMSDIPSDINYNLILSNKNGKTYTFRYDHHNFYLLHNDSIEKVVGSHLQKKWFILKINRKGKHFDVYVNEKFMFSFEEEQYDDLRLKVVYSGVGKATFWGLKSFDLMMY